MEQPPIRLPNKPEKGRAKEETLKSLEQQERAPLDYHKIAESFYRAQKQRDEQVVKQHLKQVQNRNTIERRTLYLPEVNFQNNLLYLLYQRISDRSFSFDVVAKRIKDELQQKIVRDKSVTDRDREQKLIDMNISLKKMMRGIENVIAVVQSREEIKNASDNYFIGTSDILDATRKIDLIEYAQKGEETAVRFIQVKTKLIEPSEKEAQDEDSQEMEHRRIAEIVDAHQHYIDSLLPAMQELVREDYDAEFKSLIEREPMIGNEELDVLQKKWNVISLAITETNGELRSPKGLCEYIESNIVGYSESITVDDVLFFKEIVTSPELLTQVDTLLDQEFLPSNSREMLIAAVSELEDDFDELFERYLQRNNTLNLKEVDFYSVVAIPDGIAYEIALKNRVKEQVRTVLLTQ